MVNITHKTNSLRKAIAQAIVLVSSQATIDAIQNRMVPKGDVFEFARAAGLLAIKKTSDVIPDCHPLPIEFAAITYEVTGLSVVIHVEVHTIYKTGVEVEAMHGASVTALTMYDMLKPIDNTIEISAIKLLKKSGGKTDKQHQLQESLRCAVLVCSDSVSSGSKQDFAGKAIIKKLADINIENAFYEIIRDEIPIIQSKVNELCSKEFQLIICTGGTGLSERDVTPEAIRPMIQRDIPGIMETARNYGQQRMPFAMLSRGVAGFINKTLVLTLPGSVSGAEETMDALFPYILHVFPVAEGYRHDNDDLK